MKRTLIAVLISAAVLGQVIGCAHLPAGKGEDAQTLLEEACRPGQSNRSVKGSVWMNLNSKEAKGQFPADVAAEAPDVVTLEVTNLVGAREALIQVGHGTYSVEMPDKQGGGARKVAGAGSWGGIPLRWASELFLGRIPCPSQTSSLALRLETEPSGELVAVSGAAGSEEKFVYRFRQWAGKPWPEALHWEKAGMSGTTVDFKFDDPEDKTGTPKKWEAKSSRGEVKVRWRDLQIGS